MSKGKKRLETSSMAHRLATFVDSQSRLTRRGIEFDYIDLVEINKTVAEVTGRPVKSVPQIYLSGEYVGGYTEMMNILNNKSDSSDDSECLA